MPVGQADRYLRGHFGVTDQPGHTSWMLIGPVLRVSRASPQAMTLGAHSCGETASSSPSRQPWTRRECMSPPGAAGRGLDGPPRLTFPPSRRRNTRPLASSSFACMPTPRRLALRQAGSFSLRAPERPAVKIACRLMPPIPAHQRARSV